MESSNAFEAPFFSRLVMIGPNFSNWAEIQPLGLDWKLSMPDPFKFARPNRSTSEEIFLESTKKTSCFLSNGIEWSSKMGVVESAYNYVLMVETPGVSISDIRVEVDDQNLIVTSQRSNQCWKVAAGCLYDSISAFHKREISQGPYQVVWPLLANVNRDTISTEFLDGFLRIVIPKL